MRVFIGIDLSDELKHACLFTQDAFKGSVLKANYTSPNNFHITLKYFGEVTHEEVTLLEELLENIAKRFKAFNVHVKEVKTFRQRSHYVLYHSVLDVEGALMKLFKAIESESVEREFLKEQRKYTPHITLAKNVVFNPNRSFVNRLNVVNHVEHINRITLFRSHRVLGELTYTPIYEVLLNSK